jgi:uncharacterized protein (TIGR02271 family)
MQTAHDLHNWPGETLYDSEGSKIGEIVEIYADRGTGEPAWLAVKTGLFGSNISFVPLREAARSGDGISVPYDKWLVKDSPNVPADAEISPEEERRLWEHYSLEFGDFDYDQDYDDTATIGHDTSGPTTDQAMTRSEEELRVGTTPVETGRARLRKYVVTEQVQTTVPVQREEVRIEREPITEANIGAATDGPAISEEEHEVTLYAEEPVVEKRVVPKERVRLDKETVTEERAVSEEVRKEQIETEGGR